MTLLYFTIQMDQLGGVHDIISDGVDGYIVKFGDVDAYADKLATLITSREERKRLADNAYQSVHKFDREVVMQKWCKLFSDLIKCV
ncbi:MAG: glycosyltransferase [Bacteroidales bacterium]|nr:glycosyltransferase [Bacteroidales bacterium]